MTGSLQTDRDLAIFLAKINKLLIFYDLRHWRSSWRSSYFANPLWRSSIFAKSTPAKPRIPTIFAKIAKSGSGRSAGRSYRLRSPQAAPSPEGVCSESMASPV